MTSYIQFSGELSLQTVSMFQVKRVSLSGVARITESEQFLLEEYEIGKIIRLWIPESRAWHLEAAQGIRSPTSDWNLDGIQVSLQRSESSTWNVESIAWNPESKTVLDSQRSSYMGRVMDFKLLTD